MTSIILTGWKTRLAPAAFVAALLLASCSGSVKDPNGALNRMKKAYGGEKSISLLMSYEGRGFRKKMPESQLATNYPFDIYQSGMKMKNRTYIMESGNVVDVLLVLVNEDGSFAWNRSSGMRSVPGWEGEIIKYKFPLVIDRVTKGGLDATRVAENREDGIYRLRFNDGRFIITLGLDEKTWLLEEVLIQTATDSTFSFAETYKDYVKTDGIWFPNRFSGYYKGRKYYEVMIPVIKLGVDFPEGTFTFSESDTSGTVR